MRASLLALAKSICYQRLSFLPAMCAATDLAIVDLLNSHYSEKRHFCLKGLVGRWYTSFLFICHWIGRLDCARKLQQVLQQFLQVQTNKQTNKCDPKNSPLPGAEICPIGLHFSSPRFASHIPLLSRELLPVSCLTCYVYGKISLTDVMQLTLTLKMTTAQVVETSVTVNIQQSYSGLRSPGRSYSTHL